MRKELVLIAGTLGIFGCGEPVRPIEQPQIVVQVEKRLDLEAARNNENKRQGFLTQFQEKFKIKNCKALIYDPRLLMAKHYSKQLSQEFQYVHGGEMSNTAFALTPGQIQMYGKIDAVPIFVNSTLFDSKYNGKFICQNLDDVVNVLKDHEEVHAVDVCNGLVFPNMTIDSGTWKGPLYPHDFLSNVMEVRGHYQQMVKGYKNPNVSEQMRKFARAGFEQNLGQLLARIAYPNKAPDQTAIAKAQIKIMDIKADVKVNANGIAFKTEYGFMH